MDFRLPTERRGSVLGLFAHTTGLVSTTVVGLWAFAALFAPVHRAGNTYEVLPRTLEVTVKAEGRIESAATRSVVSLAAWRTTVLSLVPEGTPVRKGQIIVQLDSSSYLDDVERQKVAVYEARVAYEAAKQGLAMFEQDSAGLIERADLALELARMDRDKYLQGDFPNEREALEDQIHLSQQKFDQANQRLLQSRQLARKGFITQAELGADCVAASRAEQDLDLAQKKLEILQKYTFPRQQAELEGAVRFAEGEQERVRRQARAQRFQWEAQLAATQRVRQVREARLDWFQTQIDACTVTAPVDGVVLYPKDPRERREREMAEGAEVQNRQVLAYLSDLDQWRVKVLVNEAEVRLLRAGEPATVRLRSDDRRVLRATVESVELLPLAKEWPDDQSQYSAVCRIDGPTAALKPGMTADVAISAVRLNDVLAVPVKAVCMRGTESTCVVASGAGQDRRRVSLGWSDDHFIEVTEGLDAGEVVLLSSADAP